MCYNEAVDIFYLRFVETPLMKEKLSTDESFSLNYVL